MTGRRLKVTELNARILPDGKGLVSLSFEVKNVEGLNNVRNKIPLISGVIDLRRGHS